MPKAFIIQICLLKAILLWPIATLLGQIVEQVAEINPSEYGGSYPDDFVVFQNKLYFAAGDGVNGRELWVSDGTEAGTFMVKDIHPGPDESAPGAFVEFEGLLYFATTNNEAFDQRGLWVTDGTSNGTVLIEPLYFGFPMTFVEFNNDIHFAASDINFTSGQELRKLVRSDGDIPAVVELVKDINPTGDSNPDSFVVYNGKLYFAAGDGVNGRELWVSDGTETGTFMVKDINPGPDESSPGPFVEFEGLLYFATTNSEAFDQRGLWVTDGTSNGTVLVEPLYFGFPMSYIEFNDEIYFAASDINFESGEELRKLARSDGDEPAAVELVKDIDPTGGSNPNGFVVYKDKLYFAAGDGVNGRELWVSDGTETGTFMLKDINPGPGESSPGPFVEFEGLLYFATSNNEAFDQRGFWVTDGTSKGTVLVEPLYFGFPMMFFDFNDEVYFSAESLSSFGGEELWKLTRSLSTSPSAGPSATKTVNPSSIPSERPSRAPIEPTGVPSLSPSAVSTHKPSSSPSMETTRAPSQSPTVDPARTAIPTKELATSRPTGTTISPNAATQNQDSGAISPQIVFNILIALILAVPAW